MKDREYAVSIQPYTGKVMTEFFAECKARNQRFNNIKKELRVHDRADSTKGRAPDFIEFDGVLVNTNHISIVKRGRF